MPVANVAKALFALQHAGLEGRLRITFELFDSDRSGRIDLQELYEILRVCCSSPFSFPVEDTQARAGSKRIKRHPPRPDGRCLWSGCNHADARAAISDNTDEL